MDLHQRLAILEHVALPLWVMDTSGPYMLWANQRGVELWSAATLEELLARDFTQVSPAMRTRLRATQESLEAGQVIQKQMTFYPRGVPRTLRVQSSPLVLDDGRVLLMAQALLSSDGFDPELVRGLEALRHMPAMVSLLDSDGEVVMHNPASMSAFDKAPLRDWFVDETIAPALLAAVGEGRVFQAEAEVRASAGGRWHAVEARRTVDPVTGAPATLILQLDMTPLRESQKRLAQKEQEIRALAAPILDVGDGVLAVPLFSALDGPRSAVITDRLLREVVARRAQSIILDLTGIERFDAASVEALMGLARATALLGARSIVTGVGPALAEALARSGNDLYGLRTLRTRRTLRDALREP